LLTFFLVSLKKDLNINPKKDKKREEQGVFNGKGFKTLTEINKAESPDIKVMGLFCFEIPLIKEISTFKMNLPAASCGVSQKLYKVHRHSPT